MWNTVEFKNIAMTMGNSSHGQTVCQLRRWITTAATTMITAVMNRMYSYRLPSGKRFAASPRVTNATRCSATPTQTSAWVMPAHLRALAIMSSSDFCFSTTSGPPAPTSTFCSARASRRASMTLLTRP